MIKTHVFLCCFAFIFMCFSVVASATVTDSEIGIGFDVPIEKTYENDFELDIEIDSLDDESENLPDLNEFSSLDTTTDSVLDVTTGSTSGIDNTTTGSTVDLDTTTSSSATVDSVVTGSTLSMESEMIQDNSVLIQEVTSIRQNFDIFLYVVIPFFSAFLIIYKIGVWFYDAFIRGIL